MDEGSRTEVCAFSGTSEELAVTSPEGEVRVWDVLSGKLKQRFVPGGLAGAAPITCLVWSRPAKAVSGYGSEGQCSCG